MIIQPLYLPQMGLVQSRVPSDVWKRIEKKIINERMDDTHHLGNRLAGNIHGEYLVDDNEIRMGLRDHADKMIREYFVTYGYGLGTLNTNGHGCMMQDSTANRRWRKTANNFPPYDVIMGKDRHNKRGYWIEHLTWVNYQNKGESNPIHTHSGDFSVVVFCKIPYDFEEEKSHFVNQSPPLHQHKDLMKESVWKSNRFYNKNGDFGIIWSDLDGKQNADCMTLSKEDEGLMILFPANVAHYVYPFYTSDEERITISANYSFSRMKEEEYKTYTQMDLKSYLEHSDAQL